MTFFQDLEKELEKIDFSELFADIDKNLAEIDFSEIEKQLQEIDLDFLLQ